MGRPRLPLAAGDCDIAITGIGVLTPLGDTLTALADALCAGRRSLAPAPEPELAGVWESRIADFDASRYANVRGMRIYNRTTRLGIAAGKLALADAGLDGTDAVASQQLGLVMGSTFGHLDTLMEYDRSLVRDGIQRTNPALMPLGLPSSPGAAVALSFLTKAFCITLANEAVSSLDAMALGARLVADGRARACLVVGAFAPFMELSLAALRAGTLATAGPLRVFDRRHCGTLLGEAGAAVVLERRADVRARAGAPRGFIRGHGSAFALPGAAVSDALARACAGACAAAGAGPAHIGLVSAGANGGPACDTAEAEALLRTLGGADAAAETPVIAVKGNLGESLDAAGLVQALVALAVLQTGRVPAIANLDCPAISGLAYARGSTHLSQSDRGAALVTATSSTGACSALILSGPDGP